jgi:hypothetical protein
MRRSIAFVCLVITMTACSTETSSSPVASTEPAPTSIASPSMAAELTPAVTPIPGCLPGCERAGLTRPGVLPAGDYTTRFFFGGHLTVTVPDGWMSEEDSTGEFKLLPVRSEDRRLVFWIDIYPIVDPGTRPLEGFDGTASWLMDWVAANPNLKVINDGTAPIGGLEARSLELRRSAKAKNVDPDCPAQLSPCVGLFGFPQWDGYYGVGGPFHIRIIALDATWGGKPHAVYAVIDADTDDAYSGIASTSMELIEGARLPEGVRPAH